VPGSQPGTPGRFEGGIVQRFPARAALASIVCAVLLTLTSLPSARVVEAESASFQAAWGSGGGGNGQFNVPYGVAVDPAGNVYVADSGNNRIQKFSGSGEFQAAWGSGGGGNGQFDSPSGLAVDTGGRVYVADSGNDGVQAFNSSGGFITAWGSTGSGNGEFSNPIGIAADTKGNVYVVDSENNRIQVFRIGQ
jgi:DNA-binding beta-propeller fold protein YncE